MMKQCCGYISLRTGTYLLAVFLLVGNIIVLPIILMAYEGLDLFQEIIVGLIVIFGAVAGIYGINHNNPDFIMLFFWSTIIRLIRGTVNTILSIIDMSTFDFEDHCRSLDSVHDRETLEICIKNLKITFSLTAVLMIAILILNWYFAAIIWAYSRELKEERQRDILSNIERGINGSGGRYGAM